MTQETFFNQPELQQPNDKLQQVFSNPEFGEIRTLVVNNEPYFVGKDVAIILGYANPQKAIRDHVDEDDKTLNESFTVNGTQGILINESGLYSLILSSKLPTAKKFKKWVTSEVLPSIRKTGGYMTAKQDDTPETIMARAIIIAQSTMERQKQQINALQADVKKLTPDAEYTQQIPKSENTWNTNVIAKEFGMSAVTLNKHLQQLGIQYKQHGMWLLSHDYQDKGYTKTKTYDYLNSRGEVCSRIQTEWTEVGRRWLHRLHDEKKF